MDEQANGDGWSSKPKIIDELVGWLCGVAKILRWSGLMYDKQYPQTIEQASDAASVSTESAETVHGWGNKKKTVVSLDFLQAIFQKSVIAVSVGCALGRRFGYPT